MFNDVDLNCRPHSSDRRGRNFLEHMVHQSVSENFWFTTMLGMFVTDDPLPNEETRVAFRRAYAKNAAKRLIAIEGAVERWWEEMTDFFEVKRSRAWIVTRRIAHTSHPQSADGDAHCVHSNYGPTADTGGLMQNHAPVIYAYPDVGTPLREESGRRRKRHLPGPGQKPPTERFGE